MMCSHIFFLHRYCNNWSNSTHYFFVLIPDCSSAVANDGLLDPAGPGKLMKSELIEAAVMALFACKEDAWPVRRMPCKGSRRPDVKCFIVPHFFSQ